MIPRLLFAISLLLPGAGFAQSRLWDANLVRAGDLFPLERPGQWDTAWIAPPGGSARLALSSEAVWAGILRREGFSRGEIASLETRQTLWALPFHAAALGLAWSERRERNHYREPGRIDARLYQDKQGPGMTWVQHVLPRESAPFFLDAAVALPDTRRLSFAWTLAGGSRAGWRGEYGLAQTEAEESFAIANLDSAGQGESMRGSLRTRVRTQRMLVRAPALGGGISALAVYESGMPLRPQGEFWFCDSSRKAEGNLAFDHALGRRQGRAWAGFRESEAFSMGRRIPPGSEGLKRFHFARNHGELWEAGGEWGPAGRGPDRPGWGGEGGGWTLGALRRSYAWNSDPPPDALDSRRETLSYNRLGLSFIANIYGGLDKVSELVAARVDAGVWEGYGEWKLASRRGEIGLGLSVFRTDFTLGLDGRTMSQRIIIIDTSKTYAREWNGYFLGATPRLTAALRLGAWRAEAEVAQVLPARVSVHETPEGAGGAGGGSGPDYPAFRNGFSARFRLEARY